MNENGRHETRAIEGERCRFGVALLGLSALFVVGVRSEATPGSAATLGLLGLMLSPTVSLMLMGDAIARGLLTRPRRLLPVALYGLGMMALGFGVGLATLPARSGLTPSFLAVLLLLAMAPVALFGTFAFARAASWLRGWGRGAIVGLLSLAFGLTVFGLMSAGR